MIARRAVGIDMISFADTGNAKSLRFGDLIIDEACMFAHRDGQTIQFTRNERALGSKPNQTID